jgi:Tol biopolymer transport system component
VVLSRHSAAQSRARLIVTAGVLLAVAFAVCLVAWSCGGKSGGGSGGAKQQAPSGAARAGQLLVTRDQSLYVRDMTTGKEQKLLSAPAGQFVTYPSWSPDGRRFVYVFESPFQGNTAADWGDDMYVANADGSNQQLLLKHQKPGEQFEFPSWTPEGTALIYSYFYTEYDAQGQYKGQTYQAHRLELASGQNTSFIENANGTNLCRDGSKLTYVNFDQSGFTTFGVMLSDADGQNAKMIVGPDANFEAYFAPTLSPDCKQIVFAAVGGALGRTTGAGGGLLARLAHLFEPAAAEAHGPPWDLWTVNVDGSGLKRITHVNEDLPYPAWSSDASTILFLGTGGLYQLASDGSSIKRLDNGSVHGQISWLQR